MALFIVTEEEKNSIVKQFITEDRPYEYLGDAANIQYTFCSGLETDDVCIDTSYSNKFLCKPLVVEYLSSIGVSYDANTQRVYSDEWYDPEDDIGRFVTHLSSYVQAACIMLSRPTIYDFIESSGAAIDAKYSAFVLKQKNVYLVDDMRQMSEYAVGQYLENGVDVIYHGKHFSAEDDCDIAMLEIYNMDYFNSHLTKELDAAVFDKYLASVDTPYPYRIALSSFVKDVRSEYDGIDVIVKGKFDFNGCYKRQPMHRFYKIHGKWYYGPCNTTAYPSVSDVLYESFIESSIDCFRASDPIDVSEATEVFTLVLNCDESCDATHYWDHVCFIGKYNKQNNLMTIMDVHDGLLEFHDIFQSSEGIVNAFTSN